jgi:murein DD-endopeptidase MepM/ murein hydrolase activator NlpD
MKKKTLSLLLCTTVFSFSLINDICANAITQSETQSKINSNNEKINQLQDEKNKIEENKKSEQSKVDEIQNQIKEKSKQVQESLEKANSFQQKIDALEIKINEIQNNINEVKVEIEKTEKNIEDKTKEQKEKEEMLGKRLRNVYKTNLTDQIIYMIINSTDLSDLISKMANVSTIVTKDNELINQVKTIKKQLEESKELLKQKEKELSDNQKEILDKQNEIKSSKKEVIALKESYEAQVEELQKLQNEKNNIINNLTNQANQIQAKIDDYEEDNVQLENLFNNNSKSNDNGQAGSGESVGSGGFIRPVGGYVSCPYGPRIHPITGKQSFHQGVDLASPSGTPIKAAKDGVVTTATYHDIYGNMIIIDHGNGFSTLYAHQTNYIVSPGQRVKQGQVIGYVGSTGWSTGPHLHFEVRINGQHTNPMNYI